MSGITIYTDGSSRGNPGPGGWGAIIIGNKPIRLATLAQGNNEEFVVEIGGRDSMTTNNRMEMSAAIEALKKIPSFDSAQGKEVEVEVCTDSEYLMKGITLWIKGWQKNNWKTKSKDDVLNRDLWQKLLEETGKRNVKWKIVEGHSGHKLNDRCDEIATTFADDKKIQLYDGPKLGYQFNQ